MFKFITTGVAAASVACLTLFAGTAVAASVDLGVTASASHLVDSNGTDWFVSGGGVTTGKISITIKNNSGADAKSTTFDGNLLLGGGNAYYNPKFSQAPSATCPTASSGHIQCVFPSVAAYGQKTVVLKVVSAHFLPPKIGPKPKKQLVTGNPFRVKATIKSANDVTPNNNSVTTQVMKQGQVLYL